MGGEDLGGLEFDDGDGGFVGDGEPRDCVFCAIVAGWVEASIVYEDEVVVVFTDLNPATCLCPGRCFVP